MNTLSAAGYLLGALLAGLAIAVAGTRRAYVAGLLLVTASLAASGLTASFAVLLALRFVSGAAGAVAFIAGVAIAAELSAIAGLSRTLVVGIYSAGAGVGIALSGISVPEILALDGGNSWRPGWWVLGTLAACCSGLAVRACLRLSTESVVGLPSASWPATQLLPTLLSYGLFGAGYIGYATFVIALLRQGSASIVEISSFWTLLGLAAVASAFAWPRILNRLHGGARPAVVLAVVLTGIALLVVDSAPLAAFISACLFGGAFLTVVTAVTTLAQDQLHPRHWPAAVAGLTTAFAVGQVVGPVLTGLVSDGRGLKLGLLVSVVLVLAAALAALMQRPIAQRAGFD